jgi:methyl-accepting chemotaxis protein
MIVSKVLRSLFTKRYWGGFKGRYVLSIVFGASFIAILMTSLLPQVVYNSSIALVHAQSKSIAGVLFEAIGISLEFEDFESVQTTFEKVAKSESSVLYISLMDDKGNVLAKFEQDPLQQIQRSDFDASGFCEGEGYLANYRVLDVAGTQYAMILGMDNSQLYQLREQLKFSIVIFVWLMVLGIVLAMTFIVEVLNKPLDVLIERMENVATGEADLTRHIEIKSNDEFGELSSWFNQFIDRIHELVGRISETSQSVVQIGNKVTEASGVLAIGAESQQVQVTDIATSLQEMVSNMYEASQSSNEATASAIQAAEAAVDGGAIIQETIQGMGEIASTVHESSSKIQELGVHSETIGNIVSVIEDIADQTNLLALNASIEAARAGEHGRGFAVVADAVRVLAERTIQATAEIGSMVKNIQSGTQNAVAAMSEGIKRVDQGVALSENAGKSIQKIIDLNAKVQEAIQLISAAASEQSNGANLIASSIETIKRNTEDAAESANLLAISAGQLDEETESLSAQVSHFKL